MKKTFIKNFIKEYIQEYEDTKVGGEDVTLSFKEEINYLNEFKNFELEDIKVINIKSIGENVVFFKNSFYCYIDHFFYQEMDKIKNSL